MAMKDAQPDARTTLDTCALGGRATVPAHQRRQPPRSLPNDADHRAGRPPHPATWASLPDTGAWTVARNCPLPDRTGAIHIIHQRHCAALSSVRFRLIQYRKPSRRPGYLGLHLVGVTAASFCKHVTGLQRKRRG